MWEIFSGGDMPYSAISNSRLIDEVCHRGTRLEKPPNCPGTVYEIMFSCWLKVPSLHFKKNFSG